jgi:hypothetical protein
MKYETVDDENFAKLTSKVVSARIDHRLSLGASGASQDKEDTSFK